MAFYSILPYMAGFATRGTEGDINSLGPQLTRLHFLMTNQPPSDICGDANVILASKPLVKALMAIEPSGVVFHKDNVVITGDDNFQTGALQTDFDSWWWLQIVGMPGVDDFGYGNDLIVSERVMNVLRQFSLEFCEVAELI